MFCFREFVVLFRPYFEYKKTIEVFYFGSTINSVGEEKSSALS